MVELGTVLADIINEEFAERQLDPVTASGAGLDRLAAQVGILLNPRGSRETDANLRERILKRWPPKDSVAAFRVRMDALRGK